MQAQTKQLKTSSTGDLGSSVCRHGVSCRLNVAGQMMWWECPKCVDEDEIRQEKKKQLDAKRAVFSKAHPYTNVPKRFKNKTLDNYEAITPVQEKLLKVCNMFICNFPASLEKGISFTFCGTPGTGKTHLAYSILNALHKDYVVAVLKTAADITSEIKNAYKSEYADVNPQTVTEKYATFDLLVIDEVGVQVDSEAERRIFFDVMNKRYENMLPTIMISNLEKKELTSFVGERVIDRMNENGGMTFAFDWKSYRR